VSGQRIIRAILAGERDPWTLADLRHERVQASREEVARSLEGNWREDVLFELKQAVDAWDFAHRQMSECDAQLKVYLSALPTRVLCPEAPAQASGAEPKRGRRRPAKPKGNAPDFDLRAELTRVAGVDLTTIDGIDVMTAQTILAEVGADLSAFPTENHFASWLGLTPGKDVSGGKVIGSGRRKVSHRAGHALRMAASTLKNSQSYLGARYRSLRNRFDAGPPAVKAMARYLAILVYRLLTHGQAWVDQGMALFEKRRQDTELARLAAKAAAKGLRLVPAE
jgi:hypothetical protein